MLTSPYPSGAPANILAIGDVDFGRVNPDRLKRDGVDVLAANFDYDWPPFIAIVRCRFEGSRDFVLNTKHIASGQPAMPDAARDVLGAAVHFHIMGSSLSSFDFVALSIEAAVAVKASGSTASFDPNLCKEILSAPGMAEALTQIAPCTDLFLPIEEGLRVLAASGVEVSQLQHG